MSNQLEVVSSKGFSKIVNWDQEQFPLLAGEIKAFIDVKHRNGNARMLIVSDDCFQSNPSPELVAVPITESLNASLKMQDAEVGDYIAIDFEVEVPVQYGKYSNLVLIEKSGEEEIRAYDYVVSHDNIKRLKHERNSFGNNRNNETDYEPKPLLIEPLVIEPVEDSTDK